MKEIPAYLDSMTDSAIYDVRLHADRRELYNDHVALIGGCADEHRILPRGGEDGFVCIAYSSHRGLANNGNIKVKCT